MRFDVSIQTGDFDVQAVINRIREENRAIGAIVSFTGVVRDVNEGDDVSVLNLEHYPGMTEKSIEAIADEAASRWPIDHLSVIHRVGELRPTDQIVLVVAAGRHRGEAFDACEFMMDYLKTRAPFWKKEVTPDGARWLTTRASDTEQAATWSDEDDATR